MQRSSGLATWYFAASLLFTSSPSSRPFQKWDTQWIPRKKFPWVYQKNQKKKMNIDILDFGVSPKVLDRSTLEDVCFSSPVSKVHPSPMESNVWWMIETSSSGRPKIPFVLYIFCEHCRFCQLVMLAILRRRDIATTATQQTRQRFDHLMSLAVIC